MNTTDTTAPQTNFTIRPASNSDTAAIREIVHTCLHEFGLVPDHRDTDIDDIEKMFWKPGGMFDVLVNIVTDQNHEVIGTVGLLVLTDRPHVCELRKMYLPPTWRGKGLGKILLDDALKRAAELGFKRMELETSTLMTKAIALYRRSGFVDIQRDSEPNDRCELTMAMDLRP